MEYQLDNGSWQGGIEEFGNLAPGNYTIAGRTTNNPTCIASIEVTVTEPFD